MPWMLSSMIQVGDLVYPTPRARSLCLASSLIESATRSSNATDEEVARTARGVQQS